MVSGVSLRRGKDRLVKVDMGLCGSSSEDVLLIANQSTELFFFLDRDIKKCKKMYKKIGKK